MGPGTRLRVINLNVGNYAKKESYKYSRATPYRSIGVGMGIFPIINLAPNARVSLPFFSRSSGHMYIMYIGGHMCCSHNTLMTIMLGCCCTSMILVGTSYTIS